MVGFAPVNKPVNVALVIAVGEVRTKSSADSISNAPVSGRVAVAIFPSGLPVVKKNCVAAAGSAGSRPIKNAGMAAFAADIDIHPSDICSSSTVDGRSQGRCLCKPYTQSLGQVFYG